MCDIYTSFDFSGTSVPQTCDPGYVITIIGATDIGDCDLCPAGFICPWGAVVAQPCTPGFYCPYDDNITACPLYTYNDQPQATVSAICAILKLKNFLTCYEYI